MKRPSLKLALIATFLVFAPLPAGCGLQSEGQRCSRLNGNEDCDTGLVCKSAADLGGASDICCPANNVTSSKYDCVPHTNNASSSSSGGGAGGSGGASSSSSSAGGGGGASSASSSSSSASSSSGGQDAGGG